MAKITIEETEYKELKAIKEYAESEASIRKKAGAAWEKYQEFLRFDRFAQDTYPSYRTMWRQFRSLQKVIKQGGM